MKKFPIKPVMTTFIGSAAVAAALVSAPGAIAATGSDGCGINLQSRHSIIRCSDIAEIDEDKKATPFSGGLGAQGKDTRIAELQEFFGHGCNWMRPCD